MKELYRFRQFTTEGVISEAIGGPDHQKLSDKGYRAGEKALMDINTEIFTHPNFDSFVSGFMKGFQDNVRASQDYTSNSVAEGVIKEEDIAEMAYERDSVEDIVKRIKPILANHPQLKKQEDPEQYLIDFVTKRKRFINKNEAPIGKDKFAYNVGTIPYDKYINLQFNKYIYSTTP